MFLVGVLLVHGPREVAVVVGGGTAILLHAKRLLHGFAIRLGDADVRAIMQFALVSLVVLPVLPDRTFGPFPLNVLNPYKIWLMVVLVVGINLFGYMIYKFVGARAGIVLGGVLGGLISSTATTLTYARRSRVNPAESATSAAVVMIACTVLWARIMLLTAAVGGPLVWAVARPIGLLFAASVGVSVLLYLRRGREHQAMAEQHNPSNLRDGLVFGAIYALVLVGLAWFGSKMGAGGLFGMAAVSGLTDMDAVTLSTARFVKEQGLSAGDGARAVIIAAMANTVFKGVLASAAGSRAFALRLVPGLVVLMALGAGLAVVGGW